MATSTINILQNSEVYRGFRFTGENDIGPRLIVLLPNVLIRPSAAIGLIQDEWGNLEIEGEVMFDAVAGNFGTITHPDGAMVSPITDAYYVGTGTIEITSDGGTTYVDVGNCNQFEFTPNLKTLDHWTHRTGIRSKDKTVVIEKSASLKLSLDEFTAANLKLALLSS